MKVCPVCSTEHNGPRIYDTQSCAVKHAWRLRDRAADGPRKYRKTNECLGCGDLTSNAKYCSRACQTRYHVEQLLTIAYETDEVPANSYTCKAMIAHSRGRKCEIEQCGITEWLGSPVLLILDHIDGDASRHAWSNLRTVCSNCDAQRPTYKARNKKSARAYRRDRYAQGLTY